MNNHSKYIALLIVLLAFSFVLSASNNKISLKQVKMSTPDNIVDSVDDIIRYDTLTEACENTTFYIELDIDTVVRSEQEFTITMYSNFLSEPNYLYSLSIRNGTELYYALAQDDKVILMKEGEGFWDGSEWSESEVPIEIGTITGDTMNFEVPVGVLSISNSLLWTFTAVYDDAANSGFQYMDGAPDSVIEGYCETGGDIQDIIDDITGGGGDNGGEEDQDDDPSDIDYEAENDMERWQGLYEIPGMGVQLMLWWIIGIGTVLIVAIRKRIKFN